MCVYARVRERESVCVYDQGTLEALLKSTLSVVSPGSSSMWINLEPSMGKLESKSQERGYGVREWDTTHLSCPSHPFLETRVSSVIARRDAVR